MTVNIVTPLKQMMLIKQSAGLEEHLQICVSDYFGFYLRHVSRNHCQACKVDGEDETSVLIVPEELT